MSDFELDRLAAFTSAFSSHLAGVVANNAEQRYELPTSDWADIKTGEEAPI